MQLNFILLQSLGNWQILLVLGILAVVLVPLILFLITLQNTLKLVSPENRAMEPGQVWLALIPLFNLYWHFVIASKMAESLAREFKKREVPLDDHEPGKSIGQMYAVLSLVTWIPVLGYLASLAAIICGIVYWVKIYNYKQKLDVLDVPALDNYSG